MPIFVLCALWAPNGARPAAGATIGMEAGRWLSYAMGSRR
jgi:hypothetical protein